jgi:hypothetical protein
MFCQNCGKEKPDGTIFCQYCGAKVNRDGTPGIANTASAVRVKVSDKWAWTLGSAPILGELLLLIVGSVVRTYTVNGALWMNFVVVFAINTIFFILDRNELKKSDVVYGDWIWSGIILVPVYLFLRASKTNKQYGYAICWCVCFAVSLFV